MEVFLQGSAPLPTESHIANMAAFCTWKTLRISPSSTRTLLCRSSSSSSASHFVSGPTKPTGLPSAKPSASSRFSVQNLTNLRLPVELSSVQSLMPLHSVTASALFTSLLSLHNNSWGCLSEGFATPL